MAPDPFDDEVFVLRSQEFEWNRQKARANARRPHRVPFRVAAWVFFDPNAIWGIDDRGYDEDRYWRVGTVGDRPRLIHVVYTWRGNRIRIISAWKANADDREEYERQRA